MSHDCVSKDNKANQREKVLKQSGFSFIELIIFITVIGIIGSGLLVGMNTAFLHSSQPEALVQASYLANARMQIILMKRAISGYAAVNDPCTATPTLAICTPLASFATANGFTVATPTITGNNPKVVTVKVSGKGEATVNVSIYNYGNN